RRVGNIFWYPASAHRRRGANGAIELGLLISVERFGRDAGEDEPRRNRIAGDAIRTQLTGRSLAKPNHTRLAGGVVSSPDDPASLLAGDARDPDDPAPTASHHSRDNGSEANKASPKVDGEQPVEVIGRELPEGHALRYTGAVDELVPGPV